MKIALGSDHRGDIVTADLATYLKGQGHETIVVGTCGGEACDYPDDAYQVAKAVSENRADRGILACGSGIGMSIAANKVDGIRAALVFDDVSAGRSRRHNDANVLCVSPEMTTLDQIRQIVDTWLETDFEGGRHTRRVEKIRAIERGEDPAELNIESADTTSA
ncbi:MAG: ribose 5-phosphate isomerase B [Planctomycetota bacterium]|nr:ribose 5-phosphate isomerase B [Planctomycetota bacterium]